MAQLKTKVLAVALVLGIAATGVTLAAGVTNTSGDGLVTVNQEPLQLVEPQISFENTNPTDPGAGQFSDDIFTTAEGATVFEAEVTDIDGGNDFNATTHLRNTADHSLFLTIEVNTSESLTLFNVNGTGLNQAQNSGNSVVEIDDGVFVTEIGPNTVNNPNEGITFRFGVNNDAAANELHEFDINYEFEEVSPSQIDEQADRGN